MGEEGEGWERRVKGGREEEGEGWERRVKGGRGGCGGGLNLLGH